MVYISTPSQLQNIKNNLSESYELANDIDMTGFNFTPIGSNSNRFRGSLDGKGYKIKNLTINTTVSYAGLFSWCEDAKINNIHFENIDIKSTNSNVGSLAGVTIGNNSLIENIFVSGKIEGTIRVSSIVGTNQGTVRNCYSNAKLISSNTPYPRVCGIAWSDSTLGDTIQNCIFNGTIELADGTQFIHAITNEEQAKNLVNIFYNSDNLTPTDNPTFSIGLNTEQFKDGNNFTSLLSNSDYWAMGINAPYLITFGEPDVVMVSKKVTQTFDSHSKTFHGVLERSKRKLLVSVSYSDEIGSEVTRRLTEGVTSYVKNVISNVTVLQNANIKTNEVYSYSVKVDSSLNKTIRSVKTISSYAKPIKVITDIYIPIDETAVVTAHVSFIENNSEIITRLDNSQASLIENKTELQVK